jgi:cell division protein FtsL
MLSTINGFDLVLIVTIVILAIRTYNLNRECEDYVRQILEISWELQQEIQASKYQDPHKHEYQDYCACSTCVPF